MGALVQDLRFAIRSFWKSPTFTTIALVTLALGIGANLAIFTVVNSVVLRPLPFPDSKRLCAISTLVPDAPFLNGAMIDPVREELERHSTSFEQIGAISGGRSSMTGIGEPIPVKGTEVSPGFWSTLRVNPALGRVFLPEERNGAQNRVVVLSDKLWRAHFQADRSIVGKSINLDGNPHVIVGVMPADFQTPANADLWTPLIPPSRGNITARRVIGRLKAGVTMERAQAESQAIVNSFEKNAQHPEKATRIAVVSMHESVVGDIRPSLLILFGAVGFILLIACANVANLMLVRGSGRRQELAVRASLGASRWRLARLLLTESSLLALCGGAMGLLLASWMVPILLKLTPAGIVPRVGEIGINGQVLGFGVLLSMATSFLFGIAPAIQLSKSRLAGSLKQDDRRVSSGQGLRGVLVAAEIALSLILLIGAGLMIKSFVLLRSVNPGFQPERVLAMTLNLPESEPRTVGQLVAYHQQVVDKFAALPGVVSAGAVNWLPLDQALIRGSFGVDNPPLKAKHFNVSKPAVSPDYFRVMGIQLRRGRLFERSDSENAANVAIISESVARQVWGDEDPVGKRVSLEDHPKPQDWLTVVGVVDDVKQQNLAEKQAIPAIYQPLAQVTRPFFLGHMAYVVRANGNRATIEGMMRSRFRELDANQPIQLIAAMDDLVDAITAAPQFYSRMLGSFSAIALLLASVGIYGVMAYTVAQRTREIGIRMALGARGSDIFRAVIGRSAVLVLAGVGIGLAGAIAVTRVLGKLLFDVKPTDAATYMTVTAVLITVALLASYVPAKRATAVDPMVALRYE